MRIIPEKQRISFQLENGTVCPNIARQLKKKILKSILDGLVVLTYTGFQFFGKGFRRPSRANGTK